MKIMNQLQEICGLESEKAFTPEDEEMLREMEAEYEAQEKVLYAFGISCILSVIVSNNLGMRMWQGKPAKYNENIAKLFFMLCTVITFVFCYYR